MTPEELLGLMQTVARQQVQITRLEQMLNQAQSSPTPES
jgi:hypothetical protein